MIALAVNAWQLTSEEVKPDLVLDIRDKTVFDRGHIPGSINLPYERFQAEAEELASQSALVLVVDPGGARAAEMAVWFRGRGRTACYLRGGLATWRGPLEST